MNAGINYVIMDYLTMQTWEIEWSNMMEQFVCRGSLYGILTKNDLKDILKETENIRVVYKVKTLLKEIKTKEETKEEGN